jgi:hypothetical protein
MKYIISIPEPCNEKWDEMTPTEQGRFCDVCATEIYDFTQISNRELVNKLKNKESICARYRKDQLDVNLYANSNTGLSRMGLLFSLTSLFAVSQPALAQGKIESISTQQKSQVLADSTKNKNANYKTIKGTVWDDVGPIPGASVLVKGTQNGTVTDFDGKFELVVNTSKKITLVVGMIGESKEVVVTNFNKEIKITINIEGKATLLEGVRTISNNNITMGVVTLKASDLLVSKTIVQEKDKLVNTNHPQQKTKKSIFIRIANLFRKKENKH